MQITEDTIIGDILDADAACEGIFLAMDMACMRCPAARGETLREACDIHDIDPAELLDKLRNHFADK